ncbi:AMP-binding protein [Phenylobacterium sp.]|uniref:AMP-binding protein n=1 Tax=Phenylobacterium sp. TaxID=1871053 RepID=UPI003BA980BA
MDAQDAWLSRDFIFRQAKVRPGKLAAQALASGRALTYRALEAELRTCESYLRATLSGPGARVAILARNCLHHITLFYGCPRAGAVFQPLNWRLTGPELAVLLEDATPELLIYEAEFEAEAQAALAQVPVASVLRLAPGDDAFAAALAGVTPVGEPGRIDPAAPSMLLYTSGTTGRPKGVIVTPKTAFHSAMNYSQVGELCADHAMLCDVPLFHVVGLLAILHGSFFTGGTVHLADRFVPAETLRRLSDPELGVSHYFCVPQMAQALLDDPGFAGADLEGLRLFTGGAPMPAPLTLALLDAGVRPSNGYGMSENGTVLGVPLDPEIARAKVGSAGVAAPAIEVRLVGRDGVDVKPGEPGEVWLRGPSVMPGYWNQPEATAKSFAPGGWFRTADAARQDEDGYYFIVDRWKDMYITGGENVYPAEVEAALADMPLVAEAAVVGVPDPRWGEAGCAYVVLRPGNARDIAAVLAWCDGRLARYKRPAHIRFLDALPRTASGKIQKDILRRAFAEAQTESPS